MQLILATLLGRFYVFCIKVCSPPSYQHILCTFIIGVQPLKDLLGQCGEPTFIRKKKRSPEPATGKRPRTQPTTARSASKAISSLPQQDDCQTRMGTKNMYRSRKLHQDGVSFLVIFIFHRAIQTSPGPYQYF